MKKQDKIMRASLMSVESIKDQVERNIIAAVRGKQLTVSETSLPGLIHLVKTSIDDGFQKSYSNLSKQIESIINESETSPTPKSGSKKK